MSNNFNGLAIKSISDETHDTKSITFVVPEPLKKVYTFKPGQYLTLSMTLNNEEVRRSYSMSSSPLDEHVTVTIKRVKGGLVSNHIHDNWKAGDTIQVMTPEGRFTPDIDGDKNRTFCLFAGGAGITPLMSILKTVLESEPLSAVYMLYGSRSEEDIIFEKQLRDLQASYSGQLHVTHILSQPKVEKKGGLGGLFKKAKISWEGRKGRISNAEVQHFLNEIPSYDRPMVHYICGPTGMMQTVESALIGYGIDKKAIHIEHFGSPAAVSPKQVENGTALDATITVEIDGTEHQFPLKVGQTIYEAAAEAKINTPYSCLSGACSTCMGKLKSGSVKMDSCVALDDDEVEDGYVLTCQSRPTTPEVSVNFDV